jgi:hypothetical protein
MIAESNRVSSKGWPVGRQSVCATARMPWNFPCAINAEEGGMVEDHGPAGGCGTPRFWPDGSLWARPHLISADARRSLTVHFGGIGSPNPIGESQSGGSEASCRRGAAERSQRRHVFFCIDLRKGPMFRRMSLLIARPHGVLDASACSASITVSAIAHGARHTRGASGLRS